MEDPKEVSKLKFSQSEDLKELREKMQAAERKQLRESLGYYSQLSEDDKFMAVQAILHIILEGEKLGTSHRALQSKLGIYPGGFFLNDLLDIHNILFTHFNESKS